MKKESPAADAGTDQEYQQTVKHELFNASTFLEEILKELMKNQFYVNLAFKLRNIIKASPENENSLKEVYLEQYDQYTIIQKCWKDLIAAEFNIAKGIFLENDVLNKIKIDYAPN